MRLRRAARLHSVGVVAEDYHQFPVGTHVQTREGLSGVVMAVEDGPHPGSEQYIVELDGGLGGGEYGPGELTSLEMQAEASRLEMREGDFKAVYKTAMADRSGHPGVDALIEAFLREPVEMYGDGSVIETLRNPQNSHGACQAVTEQFVEFATARGFKAYVTNTDLEEVGYTPSIEPFGEIGFDNNDQMQYGFYPEHTIATIVLDDPSHPYGREFYIDFTATQYGYTDHPKVLSKMAERDPGDPGAGIRQVHDLADEVKEITHAGVVIKAADTGRVLLTQRTPYCEDPEGVYGRWEFPGGSIEDDDDPVQGAIREFTEETGLELPEDAVVDGGYRCGTYLAVIILVPSEAWTSNAGLLMYETEGLGWFEPDQIEGTDLIREEMDAADWTMIREALKTTSAYFTVDEMREVGRRALDEEAATGEPCDSFVASDDPLVCAKCWWAVGAHDVASGGTSPVGMDSYYSHTLGSTADDEDDLTSVASEDYPELAEILVERPPLPERERIASRVFDPTTADLVIDPQDKNIFLDQDPLRAEAGLQTEAGPLDWLADQVDKRLPPEMQYKPGEGWSYDWCRFRRRQRCYYSRELDVPGSEQAGYAVWVPHDRGHCPRHNWDDQKVCFAGETEFLTYDGYRSFKEVVGTTQRVLTSTGYWVDAQVHSFGEQPLWRIVLRKRQQEKVIYATAEHRWFIKGRKRSKRAQRSDYRLDRTTTTLRPGDTLCSTLPRQQWLARQHPSQFGIAHGVVYGDGCAVVNDCQVDLFGEKDAQLLRFFSESSQRPLDVEDDLDRNVGGTKVVGLPLFFKERPSLHGGSEYLYGWLAGYFAADGSVDENGTVTLESASKEDLEFVQVVCNRLGIATYEIVPRERSGCNGAGLIHEANIRRHGLCNLEVPRDLYRLTFVASTLIPALFLIDEHRRRFEARKGAPEQLGWSVVSIEPTDRVEEVYCAVVPGTESFVLTGNILTGNCPVGEPGPKSGEPSYRVDATIPWSQGGQRMAAKTQESVEDSMKSKSDEGVESMPQALDRMLKEFRDKVDSGQMSEDSWNPPGTPGNPYKKTDSNPYSKAASHEFGWHFTAHWQDVQAKAKRIRSEGHVRVISSTPIYLVGEVKGDNAIYQTSLMREPGTTRVAMWECGCAWSSYSWGRSGRWKKYEGRMCSHALALNYEGQSRGWSGGEVTEDAETPTWLKGKDVQVYHEKPPLPRWRVGSNGAEADIFVSGVEPHAVSVDASLGEAPAVGVARDLITDGDDPNDVIATLTAMGVGDVPKIVSQAMSRYNPITVKVRGIIRKVVEFLTGGMVELDDGSTVPGSECLYPKYDPRLGLDIQHRASRLPFDLHTSDNFITGVRGFDPASIPEGVEVEVDPELIAASPYIRRDERDPAYGGFATPYFDMIMDSALPGHGFDLAYANLTRAEVIERRNRGESVTSLSGDEYLEALANSMEREGQKQPVILSYEGEFRWWLSEGNHRLAAARRRGLPIRVVRQGGPTTAASDYRGTHQPPDSGPPLHDLRAPHPEGGTLYPDDVYTNPHHYTFGEFASEAVRIIQQVRGNPDAMVTVYRSLPPTAEQVIHNGDWVSITRGYAAMHGMDRGWEEWVEPKVPGVFEDDEGWVRHEGDWPVISATVPARTVRNGGNDLMEWGYWGPDLPSRSAAKIAATVGPIYRGFALRDLPADFVAEIERLAASPVEAEQIDQHLGIGPLLVDYLQRNHWDPEMGLGRHWTTRKEVAQSAQGGVLVVLTATCPESSVVSPEEHRNPGWAMSSEDEITLRPGTPVTITDVEVEGWYLKGRSLLASPLQATAMAVPDFKGIDRNMSRRQVEQACQWRWETLPSLSHNADEWLPTGEVAQWAFDWAVNGTLWEDDAFRGLVDSIEAEGIKTPIVLVRNADGSVEIMDGNHRLGAAIYLGLRDVPVKWWSQSSTATLQIEGVNRVEGPQVGLGSEFHFTAHSNVLGAGAVTLHRGDTEVGFLDWAYSERNQNVLILRAGITRPEDRRQGYGTAMVKAMYLLNSWLQGLPVDTSESGENTQSGNAFIRSFAEHGYGTLYDEGFADQATDGVQITSSVPEVGSPVDIPEGQGYTVVFVERGSQVVNTYDANPPYRQMFTYSVTPVLIVATSGSVWVWGIGTETVYPSQVPKWKSPDIGPGQSAVSLEQALRNGRDALVRESVRLSNTSSAIFLEADHGYGTLYDEGFADQATDGHPDPGWVNTLADSPIEDQAEYAAGVAHANDGVLPDSPQWHQWGVPEDGAEAAEDLGIPEYADTSIPHLEEDEHFWESWKPDLHRIHPITEDDPPGFIDPLAGPGQSWAEAELHDEPEPALPETTGEEIDDDESQVVSDFSEAQNGSEGLPPSESRNWLLSGSEAPAAGGGAGPSDFDIAKRAKQVLALKAFTPAEQAQIINEGEGVQAGNLDRLDLTGTHYEGLEEALREAEDEDEDSMWMV